MSEDCAICGAIRPNGHVLLVDESGQGCAGRVCSTHTLWEVIQDGRIVLRLEADHEVLHPVMMDGCDGCLTALGDALDEEWTKRHPEEARA